MDIQVEDIVGDLVLDAGVGTGSGIECRMLSPALGVQLVAEDRKGRCTFHTWAVGEYM